MAKMTIQQRLQNALLALGGQEIESRTGKYIVIRTDKHPRNPEKATTYFWFLGRSGALRYGTTPASTKSVPDDKTRQFLLAS